MSSSLGTMRRCGKLLSFLVSIYLYCFHAAAKANVPQNEGFESEGEETFSQCEIRLLETIFNESNFPNHVRPVDTPDEPIVIKVSFELTTVMDMEEQLQILKTHCGIKLTWRDDYRDWDPAKFCNLREIGVESKELWLPDLALLNSANSGGVLTPKTMSAIYTGEVTWDGLVIFDSFCKINFSFFPYDEQKCELIFRSWSYTLDKVRLIPGEDLEKDNSMENGEWDIVQMSSKSTITLRDRKNYSDLVITIHMERRPQFYFMNIIIPCVIIYCLTLFGFCLPADSGEKIGLGITILLSLTVFMLISADMMPPTSDNFPLIAQFYTSTMVLVAASIGMSVIVLNFNHRGPKAAKAPKWMRSVLLGRLSKILFVSGGALYGKEKVLQDEKPTYRRNEGPACMEECMDDMCGGVNKSSNGELMLTPFNNTPTLPRSQLPVVQGEDHSDHHEKALPSPTSDTCYSNDEKTFIERQLRSISSNLQHLVDHHREQDEENDILDEWKVLATAVDRLCLIIFLTGSLILMTTLAGELMRRTETDYSGEFDENQKNYYVNGEPGEPGE